MGLINWYPGHIAKAQATLREKLKLTDFVLELVDARLPWSSRFDVTRSLLGEKSRIVVFTKADLAETSKTQRWLSYYRGQDIAAVVLNAQTGQGLAPLRQMMLAEAQKIDERMRTRGRLPRASRVMVVGLPNVGKSSLINKLAKKRAAQVGDKPGVTRDVRWIRIEKSLELLDTPGIIPPRLEDQELALKLAMAGSVSTESYDPVLVAPAALDLLLACAPRLSFDWPEPGLIGYARARGILAPGGGPDEPRAARMLMQDIRAGSFGPVSLDPDPPVEGTSA
ncbi:MAG: ribosome biogenesis GTPase YlqF [Candidatus Sericytochromatia bacterium]|nr:ribosome biogenesis GTPase YlqF [Candidatus Sericytochromatia bacterium]